MRVVFIVDNRDMYKRMELFQPDSIVIDSPSMLSRVSISEKDAVVIDLGNEHDAITAQEIVCHRCPMLCLYSKESENHSPLEKFGTIRYIPRPIDEEMIHEILLEMKREEQNRKTEDNTLIGSSELMESVRAKISKYAKTNYSVHFSGSTGTGKNVAAKRLHSLSCKTGKNLIYVNCGVYSNSNLLESSFFGHAKGSYTGSSSSRSGFLKNADKSSLFLDEIENMSMALQELLLDTIDSGKYRTVGTDKELHSDFRIITASNVPLDVLLKTGRLRYDFYYRIAEREIHMPDLKDHESDIPELVQDYEIKHNILRYRIRDYDILYNREWKGNIRELYKEISMMHEHLEEKDSFFPDFNRLKH